MGLTKFQQKVVDAVLLVPKGYVVSYGQVALMIGCPRCAIMVGQALNGLSDDRITEVMNKFFTVS